MGELRQYRYREVPGRKKQYASSLLSDQYLAVLSTVRSVHQRKPQRADAGAGMPEVLRKTGVFISGASADDGEILFVVWGGFGCLEENERDVEAVWSGSGGSEFAIVDWAF